MNVQDRGVLVGMSLGDGYLNVRRRRTKDKYEYTSSEIRIVHSIVQYEYLLYKAKLLKKIFGGNAQVQVYEHKPPSMLGKSYKMCGLSKSHKYFSTLKGILYEEGKKKITMQILNMLTPHGIAIWYMDDGHARTNLNKDGWITSCSTDIATYCSEIEAGTIQEFFHKEYNVDFKVRRDTRLNETKQYYIQANTKSSRDFIGIIKSYIIPTMLYKLKHVANLSLHECRAPKIGTCECGASVYDMRRKGLCDTCYSKWYYHTVHKYR